MMFYYFKIINAIGTFMNAFLRKFNYVSYRSYINGHFFLYWSFYWLLIRLLVKPWILSFSYINELSLQINSVIFTVIATVLSIILAFIPTLFTSLSVSLYCFLTKKHMKLLYTNLFWMEMVYSLITLEAWVMFSKTRRIIALLVITIIFSANFISNNNPFFLFVWLCMLYTFMYHTKVVFHIFPDYPRSNTFPNNFDVSFYISSVDEYYGVIRPSTSVKPLTKKNTREYHTTTKNLLPGEDLLSGNGFKPHNESFIRKAAQFRVLENSRNGGKLFQAQALPNSQLGTLGGKEWIHADLASANYMDSLVQKESLGKDMSKHVKGGTKAFTYRHVSASVGALAVCAGAIIGGTYIFMESYPEISKVVMKGLNSGQDLPSPEEVIKDDIDLYLESRESYKK